MRGFEMVVKWGILRGTTKSDDCEAAKKAVGMGQYRHLRQHRQQQVSRFRNTQRGT